MESIKRFLDRRGKRFWWATRFVLVALIASSIFVLGWEGGADYVTNIYTELIGVVISIGFTVAFVDRFYANREETRQTEELKRRLVREAGSRSNDIAISAIEKLRDMGWLEGEHGLLCGATLIRADLSSAHLEGANMQGATLLFVNLENASFDKANLQGATLYKVNLQYMTAWKADCQKTDFGLNTRLTGAAFGFANLTKARLSYCWLNDTIMPSVNMKGAHLQHSNLNRADLHGANLQGANLSGASLLGARLTSATLDEADLTDTMLPNGTTNSDETDTGRFTDLEHPEYKSTLEKIDVLRKVMELDPTPP